MGRDSHLRWSDMSAGRRGITIAMALVQVALATMAWRDLARRPRGYVRGPKWRWAIVIAVNFIGPLSYFRWGRMPQNSL